MIWVFPMIRPASSWIYQSKQLFGLSAQRWTPRVIPDRKAQGSTRYQHEFYSAPAPSPFPQKKRLRWCSESIGWVPNICKLPHTQGFTKDLHRVLLQIVALYRAFAIFILKEPEKEETTRSHGTITEKLIYAVGKHFALHDEVLIDVYNGHWSMSRELWVDIKKARYGTILDEEMKALT